jgi:hypothetical protein
MPLQWFAGFEAGDRNELVDDNGAVTVSAAARRSGAYGCRIAVPAGTTPTYVTLATGYNAQGQPALLSRETLTVGLALRLASRPTTSGSWEALLWIASGTTHRASLRIDATGALRLHVGTQTDPPVASSAALPLARWVYCEITLRPDGYRWRLDGQPIAQGDVGPGGTMNAVYVGRRISLAGQGYTVDIDDLFTADDPTLFGPTARVVRLNANTFGSYNGWYPPPPGAP